MAYKQPKPTPITQYVLTRTAVTNTYSVLTTDELIANTATITAYTITLPSASSVPPGKVYYVIDEGGNASAFNITVSAADNIDGVGSYVINSNYGYLRVYSTGLTWITW